ncbi:hypothetical protein RCF98_02560 [Thiothrix lacustris]|uniref:Uncharacterized protein n=1 Tax=Thiothrix lacustris TaxID=525917 RepID=A0ABY9MSV1_9GAMM|nr:hypothetical protein [Thiothrix lacustris]WML91245.1 hypothetical protein RCF98_02560 [Thiothrix lacustris]
MKKPTDREESRKMRAYRLLYGKPDQPPPKPAQPTETPPPHPVTRVFAENDLSANSPKPENSANGRVSSN